MSMEKFLNAMRMQASLSNNSKASTALGTVIGFDSNNYFVNVELYPNPDNPSSPLVTGFIPLGSPWVGNGWGLFSPPNIGDIILVEYQEGSFQNAIATSRFFQVGQALDIPASEFWLVHESGSYIKMIKNGDIDISAGSITGNINIVNAVQVNVTAPNVNISGAVALGNLSGSLTGFLNGAAMTLYNSHTHNVSTAPGTTGIPNQQMTSGDLSTNVTGN